MAMGCDLNSIRALEERLFDPVVRGSPNAVATLLSDDFVEFGRSGGAYGKKEVMKSLAAECGGKPSELIAYGYELKILAEDVVLLTYRTTRKLEGAMDLHSLRSSIWKLTDGSWKMTFHQGTPTDRSL